MFMFFGTVLYQRVQDWAQHSSHGVLRRKEGSYPQPASDTVLFLMQPRRSFWPSPQGGISDSTKTIRSIRTMKVFSGKLLANTVNPQPVPMCTIIPSYVSFPPDC